MKRTIIPFLKLVLGLALVIVVIYFVLSTRPNEGESAAAPIIQAKTVVALEERYAELGIPIEKIRIVKPSPLELEITLQSASESQQMTDDDQWWSFLARREADLAYLSTAERISSYNLRMANAKGETIELGTSYLYPYLISQQLTPVGPPAIGDDETRQLLMEELNLGGNEWLSLAVQNDNITRPNTKYVYMEWSTGTDSFEESKKRVQALGGLGPGGVNNIQAFNERYGAQIALVRVKVFDTQGNQLAHFIYDAETHRQSMWMAEGIKPEWIPRPAEPQENTPTPFPEPTTLPLPSLVPSPYP